MIRKNFHPIIQLANVAIKSSFRHHTENDWPASLIHSFTVREVDIHYTDPKIYFTVVRLTWQSPHVKIEMADLKRI